MYHNNHCTQCGKNMLNTDEVCQNKTCLTPADEEPIWPWSKCTGCGERWLGSKTGKFSLSAWLKILWSMLISSWLGILSLALILFGFLFASGRFMTIGFVIIFAWALSRLTYWMIVSARLKLCVQKVVANEKQAEFDRGEVENNSKNRKKVKDEFDKVKAYDWGCENKIWFRRLVNFTSVMFIGFLLWTYGPGDLFPANISDSLKFVGNKIQVSKVGKQIAHETSDARYSSKINYLRNKLVKEQHISAADFDELFDHKNFNPDLLIETYKKSDRSLSSSELLVAMNTALTPDKIERVIAPDLQKKSWLQKRYELAWLVYNWILVLCGLLWMALAVMGAGTLFVQGAYLFGDEISDQFKLAVEKSLEKRGLLSPSQAQPAGTTQNVGAGATDNFSSHVSGAFAGSFISEMLVKIITMFKKK